MRKILKSKTMVDYSHSHIYHNWERLVAAVIRKDEDRQLCYANSSSSLDSTTPTISRTHSFEVQIEPLNNGQSQHGGHVQQLLAPRRTLISLTPPKVPSGSTIGKIVGAARQLITPPASQKFLSQWKKLPQDVLENGCYGRVYLAQLNGEKRIAVKKLNVPSSESNLNDEFFMQASVLSRLNHQSVVELLGYWVEGGIRISAYEYATMGSLHDNLHGKNRETVLNWNQLVRIAIDAARGLEYLHNKSIIHREIRCSNILLFEPYSRPKAKIGDFSISNQTPTHHLGSVQFIQTFGYPPEFAMDGPWTPKSDVYSFGGVLLELLTGREAVTRKQRSLVNWATPLLEYSVRQCIDPRLDEEYPPKAATKLAAIAAMCVQYEAQFRPNMSLVVKNLQSPLTF